MSTPDKLSIETRTTGNSLVVALDGSASMEYCDRLSVELMDAVGQKPEGIILDVSNLTFICSLGIGAVVATFLELRKDRKPLAIVAPTPEVRDMFTVTKLGQLLDVYESMDAARARVPD